MNCRLRALRTAHCALRTRPSCQRRRRRLDESVRLKNTCRFKSLALGLGLCRSASGLTADFVLWCRRDRPVGGGRAQSDGNFRGERKGSLRSHRPSRCAVCAPKVELAGERGRGRGREKSRRYSSFRPSRWRRFLPLRSDQRLQLQRLVPRNRPN